MALILAAIAAVLVVALGQLGGSGSSARTEREVVTASDGVVQKTVTGTGNVEPVTDEDVDFQTSGTLKHVDVTEGEHVRKGQLLATLDDLSAGLTLREARATLAQARETLFSDRRTLASESSSSSDDTSDDAVAEGARAVDVVDETVTTTTTPTTPATSTTPTRRQTTTTASTPTATTATTATTPTTPTATTTTGAATTTTSGGSSGTASASTVTDATIDSDRLAVVSDEETVSQDASDLAQTRLRAPVSGTITSLESIKPGDSVSSGTDSSGSSSDSSSSDDGSSTTSATDATSASSSSSSSTAFAEIDSLHQLSMTVTFTESDISELKVGEPAVVTMDALSGVELAGKVTAVSSLGTTDDDVVSYDATVTLDQYDSRVKPGMSASAEVIIKQGHGVAVSSSAVTGSGTLASVTLQRNGKDSTQRVIVGLRGSSEDLILSGIRAGDQLVETETLPATGSSSSSTSSGSSRTSGTAGSSGGFGGSSGGFGGAGGAGGSGGGPSGGGPP